MQVPASLITTSWNLMELEKNTPTNDQAPPTISKTANQNSSLVMPPPTSLGSTNLNSLSIKASNQKTGSSGQQVYMCHMKLQDKLLKVRIDPAISADGLSVENEYSKEVGNVEMERYHALHSCPDNKVKETINSYYDKQRLNLADKTEVKLDKLIEKAEQMRRAVQINNANRSYQNTSVTNNNNAKPTLPLPSAKEGASLLLAPADETDKLNAVRKLKFSTSDENCDADDDDYLNCSVNSEDFEIDEIDVETVDKKASCDDNSGSNLQNQKDNSQDQYKKDLLKQCIEQSGLASLKADLQENKPRDESSAPNSKENSVDILSDLSANEITLPDSSTTDSPISISSIDESTNQNQSADGSIIDTNSSFSREEEKNRICPPRNFDFTQLFSTPQNGNFKMINPETLNSALSEMQKICGGPTMTFTPELRKDVTHSFTPDVNGSSPFNELSRKMNGNYEKQTVESCEHVNQFSSCQPMKNYTSPKMENEQAINGISPTDNRNNNININHNNSRKNNVSSSTRHKKDELQFENTPVFRTHRMLTAEATNILSQWYHAHVHYPYPNDEEVDALSQATGITGRQVKKWMANKRVRCFNTLSITGNHHPIKYKYQGKGRKRKAPADDKENCDSTTDERKTNYSMLTDAAKNVLNQWYEEHKTNPYPSEEEKQLLANHCGITLNQVKSWFANKRNRTNNTKRQVPNYFIQQFPEYSHMVHMVGQKREEERMLKRRRVNEYMYIQPPFYI